MIPVPLQQAEPSPELRAALALSAVSRDPFRFMVEPSPEGTPNIRGTTAAFIDAFAEIFDVTLENFGADPTTWVFSPSMSDVDRREFTLHVDAPGSATDLLGLMLPGLLMRDYPTRLVLEGCTHAHDALLPEQVHPTLALLVDAVGGRLDFEIEEYGFPPRGGGRMIAEITPVGGRLREPDWRDRGYVRELGISVILAHLQANIGEREIQAFADEMKADVPLEATMTELHAAASQGNVLAVEVRGSEQHIETLALLGEEGVRAEEIARRCVSEFATYLAGKGQLHDSTPYGLLLAVAAGGGDIWTTGLDELGWAICEYAPRFLGTHVEVQDEESATTQLRIY